MSSPQAVVAEILESAPRFSCGDGLLTEIYRQRWATFARHVAPTPAGWVVTEFTQPGPGRAHGTINAAAGHHVMEGRWLSRPDVVEDYLRFWYADPEAEPHRYSEWLAWSAREFARVHARWDAVTGLLPGAVANFEAWDADSLHSSGLYWIHDLADATECTISGDGLRPTINSYQFGNADAIAELARRAGDHRLAHRFESRRDRLRALVLERLYDPELEFFVTLPMSPDDWASYRETAGVARRLPAEYRDAPAPEYTQIPPARRVRELAGLTPWYVGLPGGAVDPRPAITQLSDPAGFAGPRGLRTAERRHPRYGFEPGDDELPAFICRWNGPSWPYSTSHALSALARIAREWHEPGHAGLFLELLRQYARAHVEADGSYWLDEQYDPDTGVWIARDWRRRNDPAKARIGWDYNHSTFVDLVLSALLGLDADDTGVIADPLPAAADLGWFEVSGLVIAGEPTTLSWDPVRGLALTVGGRTASRADLGRLRVER